MLPKIEGYEGHPLSPSNTLLNDYAQNEIRKLT